MRRVLRGDGCHHDGLGVLRMSKIDTRTLSALKEAEYVLENEVTPSQRKTAVLMIKAAIYRQQESAAQVYTHTGAMKAPERNISLEEA